MQIMVNEDENRLALPNLGHYTELELEELPCLKEKKYV